MKVSVQWLREWVDVSDDVVALAHSLTMAGLEIEGIHAAAPSLVGVVVVEIVGIERHPDAEKLNVCRVNTGRDTVQIVCGAPNVRVGMRAPLAQIGAKLPGGVEIKQAKLRGVDSFGMLCSARELGLSEDASGLMDLPDELAVGDELTKVLGLDDRILEVNLTPNRGDCMSVQGVAREVAAVSGRPIRAPAVKQVAKQSDATFPVRIDEPAACGKLAGRVIRGVRPNQQSPLWMRERLRRAGLRPISLLVDVTNYLVLELGQPMHAYDLAKLSGGITVRMAKDKEQLTLLDGRAIELSNDILVIADDNAVVGMAGIMGGEGSGIGAATTDVFLEAAHFVPDAIAGRGRRFGLITDASQRFERGVDPELPERAIERATQLILETAGGVAGPTVVTHGESQPIQGIRLRHERAKHVLGIDVDAARISRYLTSLGIRTVLNKDEWLATPPSWRFDLKIEEDLIEEIARMHGYNNIPPIDAGIAQQLGRCTESLVRKERAADVLIDRGYQEAITYSFTDPAWQSLMFPGEVARALINPISAELGVMRLSLWPGLAMAARENLRRQQSRVRLFEVGRKFSGSKEIEVISGIVVGGALPEQWDAPNRKVDFFDAKADVEALLALTGEPAAFTFQATRHSALHPGQSAQILRGANVAGILGAIHPEVAKKMDLTYPSFVFELDIGCTFAARLPQFADISRFPAIRRDVAVVVDEAVVLDALAAQVRAAAGLLLRDLSVLSVYRGEQIEKGKKSIALSLNLQDTSRTLTDEDADRVMAQVTQNLRDRLGGNIRDK
jgi:phenylalanyl-tRNA synthetase beta chain